MSATDYEWGGIRQPSTGPPTIRLQGGDDASSWFELGPVQAGVAVFFLLTLLRPPMVMSRDEDVPALSFTRLFLWVVASILLVWAGPIILSLM